MTISTIINLLESFAPPFLQEEYDNAGLITGNKDWECSGVLIALDATESIIREAIENKCNLVVAHHPIIFRGLKKITGRTYVEQTIIAAIKNDIAIYAIHTNLDNIINGVNGKIADKLGLINRSILFPKENLLRKLSVFVPTDHKEKVLTALFNAGAGNIGNYSECSFSTTGSGTYKAGENADPYLGKIGERHMENEVKLEVIFPTWLQQQIVSGMIAAHPYEEVAYDIYALSNKYWDTGSGMTGELEGPVNEEDFLRRLKALFGVPFLKHTAFTGKKVKKIAVCGGAGSFLIPAAKAAGADVFITSDLKYHEFFDAEGKLLIVDIGHYESEQFTIDLLFDLLSGKFPNFAVRKTALITNPVRYF